MISKATHQICPPSIGTDLLVIGWVTWENILHNVKRTGLLLEGPWVYLELNISSFVYFAFSTVDYNIQHS